MKKLIIALTVSTFVLAGAFAGDSKDKGACCDKTTASAGAKGACCDKTKVSASADLKGACCDKDKTTASAKTAGACCSEGGDMKSACSKTPSKSVAMSPKAAAIAAK
jgi:hypothetical protein